MSNNTTSGNITNGRTTKIRKRYHTIFSARLLRLIAYLRIFITIIMQTVISKVIHKTYIPQKIRTIEYINFGVA